MVRSNVSENTTTSDLYRVNVGGPTVIVGRQTWLSDEITGTGFTTNFSAAYANDTAQTTASIDTSDPSVSLTRRSKQLIDQTSLTLNPEEYTAPDVLFNSWRYDHNGGENLEYHFAVTPDKYRVDLYFAEPSKQAVGKRVIDVQLEGNTVLDAFDIYAETGGKNVAVGRSFIVDADEQLDLKLSNQTGVGLLQAIRITETSPDADKSFNPTTFTAANINQIQANDVVELQPGTYHLSTEDVGALLNNTNGQRVNVTLRGVPGQTIFDFRDQSNVEWIQLNKQQQGYNHAYTGITLDGLTFLNAGLSVNRGDGFTIQNSIFDGYEGKTHTANDRLLAVWKTKDATVANNYIRWNNTSKNIKALGMGGSTNGYIGQHKIEGRLNKAVQFWRYDRGIVEGNDFERWKETTGSEDHGIYLDDDSNMIVRGNTVRGWSKAPSGGSLKIKNVDHVEVLENNFYDSGILGRVTGSSSLFEHIWIHNNNIYDAGWSAISIWTPGVSPKAIRIDNNFLPGGTLTASRDVIPSLFNQIVGLGSGAAGGIYNNNAVSYNFKRGINNSGNTTA